MSSHRWGEEGRGGGSGAVYVLNDAATAGRCKSGAHMEAQAADGEGRTGTSHKSEGATFTLVAHWAATAQFNPERDILSSHQQRRQVSEKLELRDLLLWDTLF